MMLQRRIRHRADLATVALLQLRVRRRQVGRHGAYDWAGCIRDGVLGVGALESGTLGGVHCLLVLGWDGRVRGVVVDDVLVVVGDFGVGHGATCLRVRGVVGWVVGWEDRGGRAYNGADLGLSGGHIGQDSVVNRRFSFFLLLKGLSVEKEESPFEQ